MRHSAHVRMLAAHVRQYRWPHVLRQVHADAAAAFGPADLLEACDDASPSGLVLAGQRPELTAREIAYSCSFAACTRQLGSQLRHPCTVGAVGAVGAIGDPRNALIGSPSKEMSLRPPHGGPRAATRYESRALALVHTHAWSCLNRRETWPNVVGVSIVNGGAWSIFVTIGRISP